MKIERLEKVASAYGISSFEEGVADVVKKEVEALDHTYTQDGLGSLLVKDGDHGIKVELAAHMDEVGFMVESIDERGYLHLRMIGSWWLHMIPGQWFVVITKDGKHYKGLVGSKASHGLPLDVRKRVVSMDEIYLDLGVYSKEEVINLGIEIGDMVVPVENFTKLNSDSTYASKALDDRYGVAVLLEVMERMNKKKHENEIHYAFTTQEEPGLRGARTATGTIHPDLSIAIDTTVAGDTPLNHNVTKLHGGVVLSMIDSNAIYHRGLIRYVESLCKKYDVPFQYSVFTNGGTDSGNIHKTYEGSITMTLSLPIRYMHTNTSIIDVYDGDACVDLIVHLLEELNEDVFGKIERFETICME